MVEIIVLNVALYIGITITNLVTFSPPLLACRAGPAYTQVQ